MADINRLLIEESYANQLSTRVDGFKVKKQNPYQAGFRCDICGDSAKNKYKKRAGIKQVDYHLIMGCFNCGAMMSFGNYLKNYHTDLYHHYVMDLKIQPKQDIFQYKIEKKEDKVSDPLSYLIPIDKVPDALLYCKRRLIPQSKFSKIYYTDKFYSFINKVLPGKFSDAALKHDHPRLVIPFFDNMDNCFGVQGRSFINNDEYRYITIIFDQSKNKIYGLDDIDYSKQVFITEGPIDSFFIPNCLAMAGSDVSNIDKNFVIILDNEPRNASIVAKYDKYITAGHPIVIWPSNIKHKDINDIILYGGHTQESLLVLIKDNIFSGVKARIKLNNWKKVKMHGEKFE